MKLSGNFCAFSTVARESGIIKQGYGFWPVNDQPSFDGAFVAAGDIIFGVNENSILEVGVVRISPKRRLLDFNHFPDLDSYAGVDVVKLNVPIGIDPALCETCLGFPEPTFFFDRFGPDSCLISSINRAQGEALWSSLPVLLQDMINQSESIDSIRSLVGEGAVADLKQQEWIKEEACASMLDSYFKRGAYADHVIKNAKKCAISGVSSDLKIAHIIPWCDATYAQKMDPENGLLLHTDWASYFELGGLTLMDEGKCQFSGHMHPQFGEERLGCVPHVAVKLSKKQKEYLAYHRRHIWLG